VAVLVWPGTKLFHCLLYEHTLKKSMDTPTTPLETSSTATPTTWLRSPTVREACIGLAIAVGLSAGLGWLYRRSSACPPFSPLLLLQSPPHLVLPNYFIYNFNLIMRPNLNYYINLIKLS
jgi:hypothetical protein